MSYIQSTTKLFIYLFILSREWAGEGTTSKALNAKHCVSNPATSHLQTLTPNHKATMPSLVCILVECSRKWINLNHWCILRHMHTHTHTLTHTHTQHNVFVVVHGVCLEKPHCWCCCDSRLIQQDPILTDWLTDWLTGEGSVKQEPMVKVCVCVCM